MKMVQMLASAAVLAILGNAKDTYVVKEDPVELRAHRPHVDMSISERCVVDLD